MEILIFERPKSPHHNHTYLSSADADALDRTEQSKDGDGDRAYSAGCILDSARQRECAI